MNISPPFALNNEQRKYFALTPINDDWDVVQLKDNVYLYFDGDVLRKSITVSEKSYLENELNRLTSDNRTMLPPLTERGKPKKLNYTGFDSISPESMYFRWDGIGGRLGVGNYTTQQSYFTSVGSGTAYQTWDDVQKWVAAWVTDSTDDDLDDLEDFRTTKRKNIKIKEGDFFAFKIGRRQYGFGRVLLDVRKVRKEVRSGKIKEAHNGFKMWMGQPLIVKVYKKISDCLSVDISELSCTPAFLSQQIMDNRLFYGEYAIIDNLPLKTEEMDFPILMGNLRRSQTQDNTLRICFQYGLIYLEALQDEYMDYIQSHRQTGLCMSDLYSSSAIGTDLWIMRDIPAMKQSIIDGTFTDTSAYRFNVRPTDKAIQPQDLRHPTNQKAKEIIFAYFGLDANKSYWENYQIYLDNQKVLIE